MTNAHLQIGFFIMLALIASALTLWVLLPFVAPILLAAVLAIVFYPIHRRIERFMPTYKTLSASVSTFLIIVIILLPLIFFGWLVFRESVDLYQSLVSNGAGLHILPTVMSSVETFIESVLPIQEFDLRSYVSAEQIVLAALEWMQENIGSLFSQAVTYILGSFILVMALFSLLRDGPAFVEGVVKVSPLQDTFDRKIADRIGVAVHSVVLGEVVIALLQGILTGIGFWLFGIPNAAIWGFVTAIAAFVPTVGTSLIITPAIVYAFFVIGWIPAAGLLAWGVVLVGLLDNILRPIVIDRGMHINPFLILISVLGGIHVFGPIGFVAGPVILGFFFALLDIYPLIMKRLADE